MAGDKVRKRSWKTRIKRACKEAGTYRPFFDSSIDALAGILELRDNALEKFVESGGETVVTYTNKSGTENLIKNPALSVVMECNSQAMAFWRELGLTPAGLKKINDKVMKEKEEESSGAQTVLDMIRSRHAL